MLVIHRNFVNNILSQLSFFRQKAIRFSSMSQDRVSEVLYLNTVDGMEK